MDCPWTCPASLFARVWYMLVRLWRIVFTANALQARLGMQICCKCSSNCSASAQKGKFREIFDGFWLPLEHSGLSSRLHESSILMFLLRCLSKPSRSFQNVCERPPKSGLGSLLGALWGYPGRSWGALGPLLGSSWAKKLIKKSLKKSIITEKLCKSNEN